MALVRSMPVMKWVCWGWMGMLLVVSGAGVAWAQCVCEVPGVSSAPVPVATVSYLPVVAEPVVPVASAPVLVYRPIVAAPGVAPWVNPVVVYRPVLPVASPAPMVVYRPVVSAEVVPAAPVVVGRPAIVRTKVYYPGEPVRNLLKAITP